MSGKMKQARMVVEFPNLYRELVNNIEKKDLAAAGIYYGLALTLMALANIRILAARGDLKGIEAELDAVGIPAGFRAGDVARNQVSYFDAAQLKVWQERAREDAQTSPSDSPK